MSKDVDLSAEAISGRIRKVDQLRRLCRKLRQAGAATTSKEDPHATDQPGLRPG